MSANIHPSAVIAESAQLGNDVTVGPYAIINDHAVIGDGCTIHAHATVGAYTSMGAENVVHSYAYVGSLPQDLSFEAGAVSYVKIGENNDFREGVTISRSATPGESTVVGSNCMLMNYSHVAHDCIVGDHVIFANNSAIAGHCSVGDRVFMGGGAMVHQFCRIGPYVMVGGMIGVRKDVLPYTMISGWPAFHYRLNSVGLRRAGITGERYKLLNQAYRRLRDKQSLEGLDTSPEIDFLKDWIAAPSKRGIHGFARADAKPDE